VPEGRHWLLVRSKESRTFFSIYLIDGILAGAHVGFELVLILGTPFPSCRICDELRIKEGQ
jgi:hypothetical protein